MQLNSYIVALNLRGKLAYSLIFVTCIQGITFSNLVRNIDYWLPYPWDFFTPYRHIVGEHRRLENDRSLFHPFSQ